VFLLLAYLTVTIAFAALRLLPMADRDNIRARFAPEDRAFLAALLTSLPRDVVRRLRLLVRPDTVLRWHRDLINQRHVGRFLAFPS
jgi:putative transposase